MTDQSGDVFSTKEEPTKAPSSSNDVLADRLRAIVNEKGEQKYDTIEKALEGLANAQGYIPQLKTELQKKEEELVRMKAELESRGSIDDVVSRLTASKNQDDSRAEATPADVKGLDEKSAMELFERMLAQKKSSEQVQGNRQRVNEELVKSYGDKAAEVIAEKAKQLGVSPEKLGDLAGENPNLVLALFNAATKSGVNPTTSSANLSQRYQPQDTGLEKPSKSLLAGASTKDQIEYLRKVRESVYKKHGITP